MALQVTRQRLPYAGATGDAPDGRRRSPTSGSCQEPLDLFDDPKGLVELDVVAGVARLDELGGRRDRGPVRLSRPPDRLQVGVLLRSEPRVRML